MKCLRDSLEKSSPSTRQWLSAEAAEEMRRRLEARLNANLKYFAANSLSIRSKSGEIKRLEFNRAQLHIHARIEAQRKATGKVRALILKGRQQGCSSYVAARF